MRFFRPRFLFLRFLGPRRFVRLCFFLLAMSEFRKWFKYYKSRHPAPDMVEVLDVVKGSSKLIREPCLHERKKAEEALFGIDEREFECARVASVPGFLILKNPFTAAGIRSLVTACLEHYPALPDCHHNMEGQVDLTGPWWTHCKRYVHRIKIETRRLLAAKIIDFFAIAFSPILGFRFPPF